MSKDDKKLVPNSKNGRHLDGREILDPTPIAVPIGFKQPPTLAEQVRRLVGHYRTIEDAGFETPEEADDFAVGDDYDPSSPWELVHDEQFGEVTKEVKRDLDMSRREFDEEVKKARSKPKASISKPDEDRAHRSKKKVKRVIEEYGDDEE